MLPVGSIFQRMPGVPDLRSQLKEQENDETQAANQQWLSSASPQQAANAAATPGGRLYSIYDSPFGARQVPTNLEDQLNANMYGVNGAPEYARMWNLARDRATAAGGKASVRDERQTFGTAEPLQGLRRAASRGY